MSNKELINNLILDGYLKTPAIIDAFKAIDRANFIPQKLEGSAYINEPLPIGQGQTISQPLTVAFMLELLSPAPSEKILDIGSGSGWQTALLARIVSQRSPIQNRESSVVGRPFGRVVAIEKVLQLKAMTEENVEKYGFIKKGIVKVIWGDGSNGAPENLIPESGFDKIIAAAAIYPRESAPSQRSSAIGDLIPNKWKDQLKIGGRLVAPVKNSIVVIDKISETEFKEEAHYGFRFVPLVRD